MLRCNLRRHLADSVIAGSAVAGALINSQGRDAFAGASSSRATSKARDQSLWPQYRRRLPHRLLPRSKGGCCPGIGERILDRDPGEGLF